MGNYNDFNNVETNFDIDLGPLGKASGDDGVLVAGGIGAALLSLATYLFGKKSAEKKLEAKFNSLEKDLRSELGLGTEDPEDEEEEGQEDEDQQEEEEENQKSKSDSEEKEPAKDPAA